jgi:uncharacterized protein DUF4255/carboxypeptidase family protein
MIGAADAILRRILTAGVPGLTDDKLSFQPPDDTWRQRVGSNAGVSVNVYLAEIEEDRKLRSNVRDRVVEAGIVHERKAPERLRLTYLVSAWNAVGDSPANAATEAEHDTLSFVAQSLYRAAPLNAARVLTPAQLALVPAGMREIDLPTTIAAQEAPEKLSHFWGTMGKVHSHKPVIGLMVTVPVTYAESVTDGVVLTIDTGLQPDRLIEIGGHVLDAIGSNAGNPQPVVDATIVFTTLAGRRAAGTRSLRDGSFVVDGLPAGSYELQFAADGYPSTAPVPITVPPPSGGSIELLFT